MERNIWKTLKRLYKGYKNILLSLKSKVNFLLKQVVNLGLLLIEEKDLSLIINPLRMCWYPKNVWTETIFSNGKLLGKIDSPLVYNGKPKFVCSKDIFQLKTR